MIAFVEGCLCEAASGSVVISAGGLGYLISVPDSTLDSLPPLGSQVKLYTHLSVREDGLSLYGFISRDQLDIFRLLLQVSGIGPKGALALLSVLSVDELVMAIASEDVKAISRAPGVGAKTARRVILDLKDKVDLEKFAGGDLITGDSSAAEGSAGAASDVIFALTSLGYSRTEAVRAVNAVEGAAGISDASLLLKLALKKII